jgi:hypothetical protein
MSENQVESRESNEYGELWPDGTFKMLSNYVAHAGEAFDKALRFDYRRIPESLRPVFASRKIITTTETSSGAKVSA